MALLVLTNNNASNPQTLDLSAYVDVSPGNGLDPADPAFTQRVWSRSLLKEGATLALEQLVEREMQFPLKIGPVGGITNAPTSLSATLKLIQQVNAILETPGATMTFQPPGASQPTTFDILSGLIEPAYNYWAEGQGWEIVNLRIFAQPLGRTANPRQYATASGVGPLLMISPYASSGTLALAASSTGYGASGGAFGPNGASGGVSYWGNPSLAGDAGAQLQISYVGPNPRGASWTGTVPYALVSLLPDARYRPLVTAPEFTCFDGTFYTASSAVASQYVTLSPGGQLSFNPIPTAYLPQEPTALWGGQHRFLAIARATAGTGVLYTQPNSYVANSTIASVLAGDWGLYDLGTFSIRPSEITNVQAVTIAASDSLTDVTAVIMLPDNATWFLNPAAINVTQYGFPPAYAAVEPVVPSAPYTNTLIVDDVLGDQFIYSGQSQTFAPSPIGSIPSSARITGVTRGLIPRPDPRNGLPIVAVVGVGQMYAASNAYVGPPFTWANPQNARAMVQVNVLERTRYLLP